MECVKLALCAIPLCASDGNVVLFFGGGQTSECLILLACLLLVQFLIAPASVQF
jgi:hypothetical protein